MLNVEHLKLPTTLVNQTDLARVLRELNSLNDFFTEARIRSGGTAMNMPKLSRLLDQLARENSVNLLDESERSNLFTSLQAIAKSAPKMHLSFAAEPSFKALEQILIWLRQNIHPHSLVQVGLQPAIAGGCVLRTANKVFDMSLRSNLKKQETYLAQLIKGAADGR
jgi:F0F1-type ATP synthase delta subunit